MEVILKEGHLDKSPKQFLPDIAERAELLRRIFEFSADAIMVSDNEGKIRLLNRSAAHLFNLPAEKMVGQTISPKPSSSESIEVTLTRPDKDSGIAEVRSVEFKLSGNTMCVSTLRDVTELVRLREELRALSVVDELIGLCNRRGFFMFAQQQLKMANRNKKGLYLLLMGVDNLAQAKNNGDEQSANRLLIRMSKILRDTFRKSDIIARISEETFAVLAIEAQIGGTDAMAGRLAGNLEKYNIQAAVEDRLMASMGSAYYNPEQPCSLDELMGLADMLLQRQQRGERQSALIWYLETGTAQKLPSAVP